MTLKRMKLASVCLFCCVLAMCMCVFAGVRQVLLFPVFFFLSLPFRLALHSLCDVRSVSTSCHNQMHVYKSPTKTNSMPKRTLHIHQKNAKLSILNHHKLLCFKYYFVSLKVFFIHLLVFSLYFLSLSPSPLFFISSKSNFPVQFKRLLIREMKKKHSMAKSLTPHTHTHMNMNSPICMPNKFPNEILNQLLLPCI